MSSTSRKIEAASIAAREPMLRSANAAAAEVNGREIKP